MKTYLECIPCFVKQALRVGQLSTENQSEIKKILDTTGLLIPKIPMELSPPEIATIVYDEIKKVTGNIDPYKNEKLANIAKAKSILQDLKMIIEESHDSLYTSAKIAIAGNVIDLGIYNSVDIEKEILCSIKKSLTIDHFQKFQMQLEKAENILYIGDNSGEAVFDKLFLETIAKPVTFVVRGEPILNDITMKEAKLIGIEEVATVVSSGTKSPGNVLSTCTEEYIEMMNKADLIISKGQGNYEALSDTDYPIFFLLKAKCSVIAREIGVPIGSMIFLANDNRISG